MPNVIKRSVRNQTMECCKMIAAMFVVFIHEPFPGDAGSLATCLGRFAVPTFFAISGYFNFHATTQQVGRRLLHIIKLMIAGILLSILWSCYTAELTSLRDIFYYVAPDTAGIMKLLILHINPYAISGQLWYLMSLIAVYFVLWIYTCFYDSHEINYRPLYYAGFTLFAIYFTLSLVLPLDGAAIPYQSYRNGWFTGIPMFLLGLFLREFQERIVTNFRLSTGKLLLIFLLGFGLTLLQWKAGAAGEIPLGTLIQVPALLLLMARFPAVPIKGRWFHWLCGKFGTWSTTVYVIHLIIQDIYHRNFAVPMEALFAGKEPWVRPLAVFALSLLAAVIWERCLWLLKKLGKNK